MTNLQREITLLNKIIADKAAKKYNKEYKKDKEYIPEKWHCSLDDLIRAGQGSFIDTSGFDYLPIPASKITDAYPVRLFTTDNSTTVIVIQLRDKSFVWAEVKYYINYNCRCVKILNVSKPFFSMILKELLAKIYHTNYIIENEFCSSYSYPPQLKQDLSLACFEKSVSLNVISLDDVNDNGLTFKDWITYTFGICKPVNGEWVYEFDVKLKDYPCLNNSKLIV
jgi:hypothetical protein